MLILLVLTLQVALTESVEKSQQLSKEMQDDYVSTEHLLLGLAQVKASNL